MSRQDSPVTTGREPRPHRGLSRYLLAVGLVVMLAGLLFGYDQGVISGALAGIGKSFHPGTLVREIITSWVTLGAMAGALAAGWLADRLGRRVAIIVAAGIFVAGALLEALAPGTGVLVAGRLVLGAGVGIASVAAPLYGAENAPPATGAGSCRCTRWPSRSGSSWPTSPTTCSSAAAAGG
jgi:MFS transporter, SP family, galactose:H+ symporter